MTAWKFIEKKSAETELEDQLHAIWYLVLIHLQHCLTWLLVGTVYPWTALVPFYQQNLNSSIKGQAEVSPNEFIYHLVVLERLFTIYCCHLLSIGQIATKSQYQFTVY